ncbi:hypothetical protein S40288_11807, partial [Stachybotrys chartarum IBT 40288]
MANLDEYLTGILANQVTRHEIFRDESSVHIVTLFPVKRHWLVAQLRCWEHHVEDLDERVLFTSLVNTPCCSKSTVDYDIRHHIFKAGTWVGKARPIKTSKSTGTTCNSRALEEFLSLSSALPDFHLPDSNSSQGSTERSALRATIQEESRVGDPEDNENDEGDDPGYDGEQEYGGEAHYNAEDDSEDD